MLKCWYDSGSKEPCVTPSRLPLGDDVQLYYASYAFDAVGLKLTPALAYVDAADSNSDTPAENLDHDGDSMWYLGFDADMELGQASLWGTFLYNGGEIDGRDIKALLAAAGFDLGINDRFGIHGQSFYASGDDDGDDGDIEDFQGIPGQSFYWAEIMGYGVFDEQVSYGSCADRISNIMAANVGVSYAATPKLKFTGDLWYAALAEEDVRGEDELGLEVDLAVDYELIDGLNMKLVAAYLFAGDATTQNADDDENPMEIGTQFCLSF